MSYNHKKKFESLNTVQKHNSLYNGEKKKKNQSLVDKQMRIFFLLKKT